MAPFFNLSDDQQFIQSSITAGSSTSKVIKLYIIMVTCQTFDLCYWVWKEKQTNKNFEQIQKLDTHLAVLLVTKEGLEELE